MASDYPPGNLLGRAWLRALPLLLVLLLVAAPVFAAEGWTLKDEAGHRLRAEIFEQPFPEYPAGLRIRLNAQDLKTTLDHSNELVLMDQLGQEWSLPNRSEEIVPSAGVAVPPGSAQFDLDALMPRPNEALPLQMEVPTSRGPITMNLSPDQAMELHLLGSVERLSDQS